MNFDGTSEQFLQVEPPDAATDLATAPVYLLAMMAGANGPRSVGTPAAQPRRNSAGYIDEQFGGRLFERVIVTPRAAFLGPVFTDRQIEVSVWNSFRAVELFMTGVATSGPGSATLPAFVFPVGLAPMASDSVVVTFPAAGNATIAETVEFVFPGIDGTEVVFTGQRLAVLSVAADWQGGILETPQVWLTDVLKGAADAEQRIQLRTFPRSRLKYKVLTTGQETAFLEGLLLAWQPFIFGVPFWPDKQPIRGAVGPGDGAVALDWTDREFAPGGYFILWRSALVYEVLTIAALAVGSVVLEGSAQQNWDADGRTWAVPLRLGRLPGKVDLVRLGQEIAAAELAFEIEVV